jgi:hypothetical protein
MKRITRFQDTMDAQYNPRKRTESKWDDNEEDVKDDFND